MVNLVHILSLFSAQSGSYLGIKNQEQEQEHHVVQSIIIVRYHYINPDDTIKECMVNS